MTVVTVLQGEDLLSQPAITAGSLVADGGQVAVHHSGQIKHMPASEIIAGPMANVIQAFTSDDTLAANQSGLWCTNTGAPSTITLTAPAAVVGLSYAIERRAAFAVRFKPATGESINGGTADKYVELLGTGVLVFICVVLGTWTIASDAAAWNFEP